jgi:chromate transporter
MGELFTGFLLIGLMGFGGIQPSAHYVIVERNKWLTPREFVELFGVCSILPGGNFLNATVMLGDRYQGPLGSIVGLVALMLAPLLILLAVATGYQAYAHLPDVEAAVAGGAAAAAGMIIGTSARLIRGLERGMPSFVFGVATFLAIGVLRAPLPWVFAIVVPSAIGLALYQVRAARLRKEGK